MSRAQLLRRLRHAAEVLTIGVDKLKDAADGRMSRTDDDILEVIAKAEVALDETHAIIGELRASLLRRKEGQHG